MSLKKEIETFNLVLDKLIALRIKSTKETEEEAEASILKIMGREARPSLL